MFETTVGRQHPQIVPQAEPCQQGIDRSDLHTRAAAMVAQFRSFDMVFAIGAKQGKGGEAVDNVLAGRGGR